MLNTVSCTSPQSCLAFGGYNEDGGGYFEGVIDTLSGGKWTATTTPTPDDGDVAGLGSVSCTGASCVAVGTYGGSDAGLIDTRSAGTWTATAAPLPSNALTGGGTGDEVGSILSSVTCAGSGFCVVVGLYTDNSGVQEGLIETR